MWFAQDSIIGPFLVVETPAEGEVIEGTSCVVSGRAEPDSKVFVNQAQVEVSKKGEFSLTLELPPGEQVQEGPVPQEGPVQIEVTARAPDGTETSILLGVWQEGPVPQEALVGAD